MSNNLVLFEHGCIALFAYMHATTSDTSQACLATTACGFCPDSRLKVMGMLGC